MKKLFFIVLILFIPCLNSCLEENNQVRVRVISADDSNESLIQKKQIVFYLYEILKKTSYEDYEEIEKELKMIVKDEYQINVDFCNHYFPAKVYNGKIVKSGEYKTLLITIEEGKGPNFWSILYPDFFGISFDDAKEIEFRSYILDFIKQKKK